MTIRWDKFEPAAEEPLEPLDFINMSFWDVKPVPPRQWAVRDRVPAHQVTLFSGEGGSGKSIVELQLACAHVLGRDWFGSLPEPGPVIYQGCEDTRDELHRRVASICEHYDVKFSDLISGGLNMFSCVEGDGLLGVPDRGGQIEPTRMYKRLLEAANDIKPKHIGIDTSADVFGGNEIDRSQVRQFVSLLRKLAIAANGSVVLLSHPSLTGITSGTGLSGSTAWHNSVRSRIYLTSDGDMRTIEFKKNQYGPLGEKVVVRYEDGVFVPDGGKTDVELTLIHRIADDSFLELLDITAKQQRYFGSKPGTNYAPKQLAGLPQAKGHNARMLGQAMERLLAADRIKLVLDPSKKPSKATLVLVRA
ncbi:AAA family ATPase [Bradyrhizobium sp. NDS-1]|uniref:AAA family ATPase n=1 Tax=Bradyrhizobium sp. NDS-1 TaxID=3080014 RepID=UPI00293F10E0|nr:AAA family ATPase [Bradyrhizobium sp. NDS-1]WOH70649.1 AAA family ATPase [Bradyrhizobium sp. NDS-1]